MSATRGVLSRWSLTQSEKQKFLVEAGDNKEALVRYCTNPTCGRHKTTVMDLPRQSRSLRRLKIQCDDLERQRYRCLGELNGQIQAMRVKYRQLADKRTDLDTVPSTTADVCVRHNSEDEGFAFPPGFRFSRDGDVKHPRPTDKKETKAAREKSLVTVVGSAVVPSFVIASGNQLRLVGTVQDHLSTCCTNDAVDFPKQQSVTKRDAHPPGCRSAPVSTVASHNYTSPNIGNLCRERLFPPEVRYQKSNCQVCEIQLNRRLSLAGYTQSATASHLSSACLKRPSLASDAVAAARSDGPSRVRQHGYSSSSPELNLCRINEDRPTLLDRANSLGVPTISTTLSRLTPSNSRQTRAIITARHKCVADSSGSRLASFGRPILKTGNRETSNSRPVVDRPKQTIRVYMSTSRPRMMSHMTGSKTKQRSLKILRNEMEDQSTSLNQNIKSFLQKLPPERIITPRWRSSTGLLIRSREKTQLLHQKPEEKPQRTSDDDASPQAAADNRKTVYVNLHRGSNANNVTGLNVPKCCLVRIQSSPHAYAVMSGVMHSS